MDMQQFISKMSPDAMLKGMWINITASFISYCQKNNLKPNYTAILFRLSDGKKSDYEMKLLDLESGKVIKDDLKLKEVLNSAKMMLIRGKVLNFLTTSFKSIQKAKKYENMFYMLKIAKDKEEFMGEKFHVLECIVFNDNKKVCKLEDLVEINGVEKKEDLPDDDNIITI